MTVSYVGSSSNESSSLTLPTHQAGDLIIVCALRTSSSSNAVVPSGWTLIGVNAGLNSDNLTIAYRIATSAATVSGTWTNAEFMVAVVYRDSVNYLAAAYRNGSRSIVSGTTTPTFPSKSAWDGNTVPASESIRMVQASSWVIGIVSSTSNSVSLSPVPSGMTNRVAATGASTRQIAVHDTNGNVSSWASATSTLSSSAPWITSVFDLIDTGIAKAASGKPSSPFLQQVIA